MKLLFRLALAFVLLLLLALGAAFFFLGPIVGAAIGKGASWATGVEASVEKVDVGLMSGALDLSGLRIANPPGFASPHFLAMQSARARWEGGTVFSDRIEISVLLLDGFDLNFERNASGSNWKPILDRLEQVSGPERKEPAPSEREAGSSRTLHIGRIELRNVKVALLLADVPLGAGTHALSLPTIVIEDFKSDGSTLELVSTLTRAIVTAVLDQSVKSGGGVLPKDLLKDLGKGLDGLKAKLQAEAGRELEKSLDSGVKKALEGVEDLFKKK